MTPIQTPAGFSLNQYIYNVKKAFEDAFYTNEECPIIKTVIFAPTSQYEATAGANNPTNTKLAENIEPPAIIIDPYEGKIDPSFDEYTQERDTPHTNTGNLALYLFVKALVLVINNKNIITHLQVRQLAFDIAGVVTEQRRFGASVGMSQVTHISELQGNNLNLSNRLIGWTVQWQHSLEIEAPDYSNIGIRKAFCDSELEADAIDIYSLSLTDQEQEAINISSYHEFTDETTFAAEAQPSWSIGRHTSKSWLLFHVEDDSHEHNIIQSLQDGQRIGIVEPSKNDKTIAKLDALHIYTIAASLKTVTTQIDGEDVTYYQIEIESDPPTTTELTVGNSYFLKLLAQLDLPVEIPT